MKKVLLSFLILFSCGSTVKESGSPRLIKASSPNQPYWILKKKATDDNYYFVGISKKNKNLQEARKSAIDDAVSRLLEFIGFRVTTKFESKKEYNDIEEGTVFRENIIQSIEGKASASVATEIEDVYYEEYTDGYVFYVMIKSPVKWVENERKRLKQLVLSQREESTRLLNEAKKFYEAGEVVKAIDNALSAFEISERAEENSDIYLDSKDFISQVLSSLRISLNNNPSFVYREGGSDDIEIVVKTTKNYKPVKGLLVAYECNDSGALITAKKGFQTDENGVLNFNIEKVSLNNEIEINFYFSLKRFEKVNKIDEEFYNDIKKYSDLLKLKLKLKVTDKFKAIPSAVVLIDVENEKNRFFPKFQEEVTGKLANKGFQVKAIDISKIFKENDSSDSLRDKILKFVAKDYKELKNLILIYRNHNYLGELGKDIKFTEYDLGASEIKIYEIQTSISIINIATKETERGYKFSVKGQGLNKPQAIDMADKNFLDKLDEFFN
ncbi:MAG: hypothetical protein N2258_03855 [Brevinematales bacterium]|nr:hypothetical protein [Brevinematales bacterium]